MQFDSKAPTGLMLGRYQPWHKGHRTLFEKILEKKGRYVFVFVTHKVQVKKTHSVPMMWRIVFMLI